MVSGNEDEEVVWMIVWCFSGPKMFFCVCVRVLVWFLVIFPITSAIIIIIIIVRRLNRLQKVVVRTSICPMEFNFRTWWWAKVCKTGHDVLSGIGNEGTIYFESPCGVEDVVVWERDNTPSFLRGGGNSWCWRILRSIPASDFLFVCFLKICLRSQNGFWCVPIRSPLMAAPDRRHPSSCIKVVSALVVTSMFRHLSWVAPEC